MELMFIELGAKIEKIRIGVKGTGYGGACKRENPGLKTLNFTENQIKMRFFYKNLQD